MLKLIRKKKEDNSSSLTEKAIIMPFEPSNRNLQYLIEFVKRIRPSDLDDFAEAELKFRVVLFELTEDKNTVSSLRKALLNQFVHSHIVKALCESGIITSRNFLPELIGRIKHKILPTLHESDDFLYVINTVFYKKRDHFWVRGIDQDLWVKLFQILGMQISLNEPQFRWQLQQALQVLSYQLAASGLERSMSHFYGVREDIIQPFLDQNHWINELLSSHSSHSEEIIFSNIEDTLHTCRQSIQWIRSQRKAHGTSLAQTYLIKRLQQQIERLFIITNILNTRKKWNITRLLAYFTTVIMNENTKNSIGSFISENLGMLAYQIAEHKGKKGENYLTITRSDLRELFNRALGGGFLISFIVLFRSLLGFMRMAPFWQGFAFSSNYAFGFVLTDRANAYVAAVQPAYTSASLASSPDSRKVPTPGDLNNLAATVAKACRTQIASFFGNLLVVLPLSYGLAWLFNSVTKSKLAAGAAANQLIADQHPWHSPALIYAFFTGIAIFLSGLIAGYVENHVVFGNVGERLQQHPVLQQSLSRRTLSRIVQFVTRNSGTLAGSLALGMFFGFASPLGRIVGVPFDFRHVTISAGNAAIGYFGIDHTLPASYIITIISGIILIGVVNFTVSFSLAFFVALKSRGIQHSAYAKVAIVLLRYFIKQPANFIGAPR